jgi:hypothetical protein
LRRLGFRGRSSHGSEIEFELELDHRGRDGPSLLRLGPPPAQIPAGAANALGSCLGWWR